MINLIHVDVTKNRILAYYEGGYRYTFDDADQVPMHFSTNLMPRKNAVKNGMESRRLQATGKKYSEEASQN